MEKFALISLGAMLGANARYWLGDWAAKTWGAAFPFGTTLINMTGSFILAFFMTFAMDRFMIDPRWRIFFAVGFLGSYTTFSTYTYESINLTLNGHWAAGLINLFGSAVLGGISALFGVWVGRFI